MSAQQARRKRRSDHTFRLRPLAWSLLLACGGLSHGVQAAETQIADMPLAVLKTVQPNVYITLDKSGSMQGIMGEVSRKYTKGYNNTVRYRPWLVDGITPPPRGPVRFEEVDMDVSPGVCSGMDFLAYAANPSTPSANEVDTIKANADSSVVWAKKYVSNTGSTPDYIQAGCSVRGLRSTTGSGTDALREGSAGNGDSGSRDNAKAKIDNLITNRPTGTPPSGRTDCSPTGCTAEQERKNISNYWQYHRNRYLAARAAIGEAIGRQKGNARIGFANFSTHNSKNSTNAATGRTIKNNLDRYRILTISPYDSSGHLGEDSPRYKFFAEQIYNQTPPYYGTPTRKALYQLGEYFKTDEPYRDDPASASSPTRSCRANYNILITDGGWNDDFSTIKNADGSAGAPYQDSFSSTLADVAYEYYANDLMDSYANNVPTSVKDPANWQHLVNYTVSMNMPLTGEGKEDPDGDNVTTAKVNKIFEWMNQDPETRGEAPKITWPDAIDVSSDIKRVDDLAHAGINSHGGFINASNPQELTRAILAALNDAVGRSTSAPVAVTNNPDRPLQSGDVVYLTGYDAANWSGQLRAFSINPLTGGPNFDDPKWTPSADRQLGEPVANNRLIVTWKGRLGAGGISFKAGQSLADGSNLENRFHLNAAGNDGANVIAYLRGSRTNEGLDDANYRERDRGKGDTDKGTVLGDIVDSGAILNLPGTKYEDPGHEEFRTAQESKEKTVFVGANDGMVHAFDAATGAESWAYVPSFGWDCLLADNESACPRQPGSTRPSNFLRDSALPFGYQHRFFVNGPLFVTDVNFSNGSSTTKWRTILTGTLGKGGRGVFALDVTDPQANSETIADSSGPPEDNVSAVDKVLWEFPARLSDGTVPEYAKNMGYVFSQIHMGKVNIGGNTKWVAYVPSGFNNGSETGGDGKARLFVLDAKTGELIKEIVAGASDTKAGSSGTPAGMAHIAVHMKNQAIDHSGTVVYGGDQLGNLWRFDLTSTNTEDWEAEKVAVLEVDDGELSGPQPVTTSPIISEGTDQKGNRRLFIMVGTGRYLDTTDRPENPDNTPSQNKAAKQTQSFYVFKDPFQKDASGNNLEGGATLDDLRSVLSKYTISAPGDVGETRKFKLAKAPPENYKGFYFDLTASNPIYERVNVQFRATPVAVVLGTNAPSTDACDQRGKGSSLIVPLVDIPDQNIVGLLGNTDKTLEIDAGTSLGSLVITGTAVMINEEGELVAVHSVADPISSAECDDLRKAGFDCKAGEPYVWEKLKSATQTAPKLPTRRVYWRDMSIE